MLSRRCLTLSAIVTHNVKHPWRGLLSQGSGRPANPACARSASSQLDPLVQLGGLVGAVAGIADRDRPLADAPGHARELEVGDERAGVDGGGLGDGAQLVVLAGAVAVADGDPSGQVGGGGAADDEAVVAVEPGAGQREGGARTRAAAGA